MSNETTIKARLKQKRDSYSNWLKAGQNGFAPLAGEFIIYAKEDKNENGEIYQRYPEDLVKIGDGVTPVHELPFDRNAKLYLADESAPENALTGTFKVMPSTDAVIDANNGASSGGGQKLYRHDISITHGWRQWLMECMFTIFNTDPTNYTKSGMVWIDEEAFELDEEASYNLTTDDVLFIPEHKILASGALSSSIGNDGYPIVTIRRSGDEIKFGHTLCQSGIEDGSLYHHDYIEENIEISGADTHFYVHDIEEIVDTVTEVM